MKATMAVLCFLAAVVYAIVVDARIASQPIDNGALNPKCEKPKECPGSDRTVYYYNRKEGCKGVQLGKNCTDNGNYDSLELCNTYCLPAPGKQPRLA
uniref:Putative secreted protein n=1 Tax=Ixodes scapularis TaxID=6945 RepID=Q8MVC7_IXOSC|nr:putative secreted protein [Ixodes scapularis]